MKKTLLLSVSLISFIHADFSQIGLDYLNSLRKQAGMIELKRNNILETAAYNHNLYMDINNVYGHREDPNLEGFTGETPSDRALYAGYEYRGVSENLSKGQENIYESIDGLFSAIYHRLGFLNEDINEIGVDEHSRYYTYDMGNSYLNALCQDENSYDETDSYYTGICKDTDKKISFQLFHQELNKTRALAPDLILWPPKDSSDIPPVFYDESPDPLPDYNVSGYPVSVTFNVFKTPSLPSVTKFILKKDEQELKLITLMTRTNDPNKKFNDYQFAIFPEQRLEWGKKYNVELEYKIDENINKLNWCFSTRSLKKYGIERYYEIQENEVSLNIEANTSYAFYFPPKDRNDTINHYQVSYSGQTPDIDFIDSNTLKLQTAATLGNILELYINDKVIRLTIANNDTAQTPSNELCIDNTITDTNDEDNTDNTPPVIIKTYDITSFYIGYDDSDNKNYALIMPMVNKIYVHKSGNIHNLKRVDTYFKEFAHYNNGELCFSNLKTDDELNSSDKENKIQLEKEFNISTMSNKCYEVNYFYIQKEKIEEGVSFLLFVRPESKLYEGLAGKPQSFKIVKDATQTYNENSITNEDYSFIKFDLEKALIEIRSYCQDIDEITGQCKD